MTLESGIKGGAIKTVLYGPEGIGKSTFAAGFPGAVFCDTEGSTSHMDVTRFPAVTKWDDIMACIDYAAEHPEQVGTFVLDTADWAEKFGIEAICKEKAVDSIESFGYGKGYVMLKEKFAAMLAKLDKLIASGINVVITAHAAIRKFEQPDEMGAYDRYTMKLNEKNVAPIVKEWADMVLFANYKVSVVTEKSGTKKATGGKRVMYTNHTPSWDAKNRFGLPEELPFEYKAIQSVIDVAKAYTAEKKTAAASPTPKKEKAKATNVEISVTDKVPAPKDDETSRPASMQSDDPEKDKLLEQVWQNMVKDAVPSDLCLQTVVADRGYYDFLVQPKDYEVSFISGCLIQAWGKVLPLLQDKFVEVPF